MAHDFQPIRSYGGGQLLMGVQANLYTEAVAYDSLRFESIGGYVTQQYLTKLQAQHGKRNDADFADPYILYENVRPDALTVTMKIRKSSNDAAKDPPIVTILESLGFEVIENSATTVAGYVPATGVLTFTADVFGGVSYKNICVLTTLDDGRLWPTLLSSYDHTGPTGVCAVKLPSTPTNGNAIDRMYSCVPMLGKIDPAKCLSFQLLGLGPSLKYIGCACSGFEISEITPAGDLTITFSFHVLDVAVGSTAMSADDFQDHNTELLCHGAQVHFSDYAAPPMEAAPVIMNRIKFACPYKSKPIGGVGNTTTVLNEVQCYAAYKPEKSSPESRVRAELDHVYDTQAKTDYDAGTAKSLVYTRHTAAIGTPALLVATPKAKYLDEPGFEENADLGCYTSKNVLGGTSPDWDTNNDPSKRGNRDFILAISGEV